MSRASMSRYEGTTLEGRAGLVVAVVLAAAAIALVAVEWLLLPDQVVVQFGMDGEHYAPKMVIALATAALGLGGSAWLAVSRAKVGLLVGVIGVGLAALTLVINLVLF